MQLLPIPHVSIVHEKAFASAASTSAMYASLSHVISGLDLRHGGKDCSGCSLVYASGSDRFEISQNQFGSRSSSVRIS